MYKAPNPIQKALQDADQMDRRRQAQISRQRDIITRLVDADHEGALTDCIERLDAAEKFIQKNGLWDQYQKGILEAAAPPQPQQDDRA